MLPDMERKLLRILVNYPMHRRKMPTMRLIEHMTGRDPADIREGLQSLERKGYILWQDEADLQSIVVFKGEEEDSAPTQQSAQKSPGIDYWTYY